MSEDPDWLDLIALVPDDDRACGRCGADNPELDVEFCGDRRCPYKPQPVLILSREQEGGR
jgi:hypothetical protein